jgi:hypothetical protein
VLQRENSAAGCLKYSGAINNEIGELFGGLSYSAVTKIAQSFFDADGGG